MKLTCFLSLIIGSEAFRESAYFALEKIKVKAKQPIACMQ